MVSRRPLLQLGLQPLLVHALFFLTLNKKFKAVTKGLQSWSDKAVGQVSFQLALAREILHQFEIAQDNRQLSPGEVWLKNNMKKHSLALASSAQWLAYAQGSASSKMVVLIQDSSICTPDTGKGRILLGNLLQENEFARLQSSMIFMKTCQNLYS
jgi:hypothetical protein